MAKAPRKLSNTRPRDALGRPLPWGATGAPMVPERLQISTHTAVTEAIEYLTSGRPFHAHEVLEQRWRCAPHDEQQWWRALAQAAAGVTQAARGNSVGAQSLAARSHEVATGPPPVSVTAEVDATQISTLTRLLQLN
jgi:predicted metal-dependent hydrolase